MYEQDVQDVPLCPCGAVCIIYYESAWLLQDHGMLLSRRDKRLHRVPSVQHGTASWPLKHVSSSLFALSPIPNSNPKLLITGYWQKARLPKIKLACYCFQLLCLAMMTMCACKARRQGKSMSQARLAPARPNTCQQGTFTREPSQPLTSKYARLNEGTKRNRLQLARAQKSQTPNFTNSLSLACHLLDFLHLNELISR